MVQLFHDHNPPYGLLVDSFEAANHSEARIPFGCMNSG